MSWYKDAIIYQLHVKTFCDGNGDGVGDFEGLIGKLDYLSSLGVTCLWLLPFYPSPLRDDGYDVADYEGIHPRYGSMADFDRFVAAAHDRGLRVIVELVANHTSDQHPWFQAARRAPAGSPERDFYVWSDTDRKYRDVRVIFADAESSNWEWDPVAGAYYWHRFFRHQPDLNFDNPAVRDAMIDVMRFWLDRGVDGLRLDAVAHLFEREGTTCEDLPETHLFLKALRAELDRTHPDCVLLAEANDTPADLRLYFGDGDECHMAFNFPLMPRIFEALKRETAQPIVDAIVQTSDVPASCQWAVFLRNHDDLTLSVVSEEERAFLTAAYAPDPRMRLNKGIRRRLAPLLDNDRARLELAYGLLLSLPGSPVVYYGDEIAMGDDVRLPDRDGLRLPMPWNDAAAQAADEDSLLTSVKRLIQRRRTHPAFGRGDITFPECDNARVLMFARHWNDDTVFVVANLATRSETVTVPPPWSSVGRSLTLAASACRWLPVDGLGAPVQYCTGEKRRPR